MQVSPTRSQLRFSREPLAPWLTMILKSTFRCRPLGSLSPGVEVGTPLPLLYLSPTSACPLILEAPQRLPPIFIFARAAVVFRSLCNLTASPSLNPPLHIPASSTFHR